MREFNSLALRKECKRLKMTAATWAQAGLGAIMIETLNSSGEVVDADTILSDTPSLSVRKLIAL